MDLETFTKLAMTVQADQLINEIKHYPYHQQCILKLYCQEILNLEEVPEELSLNTIKEGKGDKSGIPALFIKHAEKLKSDSDYKIDAFLDLFENLLSQYPAL